MHRKAEPMMEDHRHLFKLLSVCLSYPDETLFNSLGEIEADLQTLADPARKTLLAFIDALKAQSRLAFQEHYTAVFDLNPAACLNLTYHLMGDGEARGRVLAEMQATYHRAGFEISVKELPDYLPLVLEFLAEAPGEEQHTVFRRSLAAVPAIAKRLEEAASPYAAPLRLLGAIVPANEERTTMQAATSATPGPPDPKSPLGVQS